MKKGLIFLFLVIVSLALYGCENATTLTTERTLNPGVYYTKSSTTTSAVMTTTSYLDDKVFEKEELDDDLNIRYVGRTEYKDEQRYMYYTGTGFIIKFYGTSLSATFNATNTSNTSMQPYFRVMLDDEIAPEGTRFHLTSATETVTLVSGLTEGEHTVEVLKESEPYDSLTSLVKLETNGSFLSSEEFSGLKIEIVGASGASGHGSLGTEGAARTTANSSSLYAFPYLVARMLDADFSYISNSGAGLVWGRGTNMRTAYDYVGLDTSLNTVGTLWDHTSYVPDVMIVNIGGNDFTSYVNNLEDQSAAKEAFRLAVTEFLTYVHTLYPDLLVIWTHTGSNNGAQAESAISDYAKKSQVKVVIIPKVGANDAGEGANGHYSIASHIEASEAITKAIENALGITRTRNNIEN